MTQMLSEHFSLAEFTDSDTAIRLGINNTPNAHALANLHVAAAGMEEVRAFLDCPVLLSSGFRCEALERVICEKDFRAWCGRHGRPLNDASWANYYAGKGHPKGFCADFRAPKFGSPAQIVKALAGSGIKFDQLICEGTWVHASFDPRMRGQVLSATFTNGTPTYSQGVA